jgi:S-(hydroxymethyl)glutathione dehydrogenase/alcohol dehydrogenase
MPTASLAAVLRHAATGMSIAPVNVADPDHGEVLVRTTLAAVCGTDVHFATGRYPFPLPAVLGHEATGIVEAVGPGVTSIRPGDRVLVCDRYPCGHCARCATGDMAYCTDTSTRPRQARRLTGQDGPLRQYLGISAFAQHMLVDANAVIPAPDGLSDQDAALLSCGVTTGLAAILNNHRPDAGSAVAVIGCGAVGLGAVIAARLSGAETIIAVDPHAHRREAAAALGATLTLEPGDQLCQQILDTSGGGVDRAIEAVGTPDTALQALTVLRRGGHATVLGMMPNGADLVLPARLLQEGRAIGGAVMGRARVHADIPRYARLAAAGGIDLSALASAPRPLAEINSVLDDAAVQRGIRQLIAF